MSQLSAIKDRVRTITNLHKVTKAMEMVTRTKIHKMRQNAASAKDYQELYAGLFGALALKYVIKPGASQETSQKYCLAFFSQKGFCGGFNEKLLNCLRAALATEKIPPKLYLLGRFQAKWKHVLAREFQHIAARENTYREETAGLVAEIGAKILAGEKIEVYFIYNRLVSVLEQTPLAQKIYPPDPPAVEKEILLEPDVDALYPEALKGYLTACLAKAYWESAAGEYYFRLLSMKNANDNAELILGGLLLEYNKTRQTRITQELSEVISAFDVLKVSAEKKERGV